MVDKTYSIKHDNNLFATFIVGLICGIFFGFAGDFLNGTQVTISDYTTVTFDDTQKAEGSHVGGIRIEWEMTYDAQTGEDVIRQWNDNLRSQLRHRVGIPDFIVRHEDHVDTMARMFPRTYQSLKVKNVVIKKITLYKLEEYPCP